MSFIRVDPGESLFLILNLREDKLLHPPLHEFVYRLSVLFLTSLSGSFCFLLFPAFWGHGLVPRALCQVGIDAGHRIEVGQVDLAGQLCQEM